MVRSGPKGEYERCNYRYNSKPCPQCNEPLDIAARECNHCGCQVVDPNEKLISEFVARRKDPTMPQTEKVISLDIKRSVSQRGNATIRADFVTPYRQFSCWYMEEPKNAKQARELEKFQEATRDGLPETVSYVRDRDTTFFRIIAFNKPADEDDLPPHLMARKEIEKLRKYA